MMAHSNDKKRPVFGGDSKAEETLRNIVENSTNLFYMHTADHVLTYVSPQSQQYFDCKPEEALVHWTDFITDHPANQLAVEMTQRAIDTGERQPSYEVECIGRKGRKIWVEVNETPIVENGQTVAVVGSLTDITERKLAVEKLRHSEERYRHLYKDTPVMLHSIDQNGRLVSVSNYWTEALGYERSEVIGKKITQFFTEESQRYAEAIALPRFFRTGFVKEIPYQLVKKNGEIIDVLLSATLETNKHGEPIRSLAVMVDVTDRLLAQKKIEKLNVDLEARALELERANRELKAFSYSVSHDLRKPLTVINCCCQIIDDLCGTRLNDDCRHYFKEISNEVLGMGETIDALLSLSCATYDDLNFVPVDLSSLAKDVASDLALAEPVRQVKFKIAYEAHATGDRKLLKMVMENLIGNAWKYSSNQEEALIEFGIVDDSGQATYFVRDNGIGFDMSHAEKLFAPFQRLPSAEEFKGYGVGLATVERIIHRHGGRVWAEANRGEGATFYFTLSKESI